MPASLRHNGVAPAARTQPQAAVPGLYTNLRQSFPYLVVVAGAVAVLVFGFVLLVATLAKRRDPMLALAAPRRARVRRRAAGGWDYTFDATDEHLAGR